jgi:hypothetical protein
MNRGLCKAPPPSISVIRIDEGEVGSSTLARPTSRFARSPKPVSLTSPGHSESWHMVRQNSSGRVRGEEGTCIELKNWSRWRMVSGAFRPKRGMPDLIPLFLLK